MDPCSRASLPALLLAASLALPANAGVPAPPPISTVPSCFATCPMGDMHIVVVVRDLASNPIANSTVVLDFSTCAGEFVCTNPPNDPYIYDPTSQTIRMLTDVNGRVDFPLRVGGGCGPGGVRIFADGVLMQSYALASPDQGGNGLVHWAIGANDLAILESKMGSADLTGDFDCDGDVDGFGDEHIFFEHLSHACEGIVNPAKRGSWGRIKTFYR